jgi:hypothetical protein
VVEHKLENRKKCVINSLYVFLNMEKLWCFIKQFRLSFPAQEEHEHGGSLIKQACLFAARAHARYVCGICQCT